MLRHRATTVASLTLLMLAALGAMLTFPAAAQVAPAVINSWALTPAGPQAGQPGSRPNFSYELAAGAKINDSISIFNYGNTQLTFHIYGTDAFNDPTGAFNLLPGDQAPKDAGSWVKLGQANLTVAPRTRADLPMTLTVPPDARPGDHAAAILASSTVAGHDSLGKIVNLDRRAGSRLYVRVAGPLVPQLTVDNVHSTYHVALNPFGGSVDMTYTIKNTGNVRLGAHQQLALKAPFGRRIKQQKPNDVTELLPGNSVILHAHFNGVTAVVRIAGQVVATGFPVGANKSSTVSPVARVGRTWAIPWTLLALVALATLAWQGRRRYLYRQQQRQLTTSGLLPAIPETVGR